MPPSLQCNGLTESLKFKFQRGKISVISGYDMKITIDLQKPPKTLQKLYINVRY